jgi:alpha-tubulin suppressor-like RCC1 family protein
MLPADRQNPPTAARSIRAAFITVVICASSFSALLPIAPVFAYQYGDTVLSDNPALYWPADEGSGTTLNDPVGGRSATVWNTASWSNTGLVAGSSASLVGLDGQNGYASTAASSEVNGLPLGPVRSIEFWFSSTDTNGSPAEGLVSYWGGGNAGGGDATNRWTIAIQAASSISVDDLLWGQTEYAVTCNSQSYFDGSPHMVDYTGDGTTNNLYIDGALCATHPQLNNNTWGYMCGVGLGSPANPSCGPGTQYEITPLTHVGQLSVYGYALTPVQINHHFVSAASGSSAGRYVALGDSYSSGEGVPPFISPTDVNGCHRSLGAYPELIPNRTGVPPTVEFWACSGATIRSFYKSVSGEQPQLDELAGVPATLITLGVGGNDIGFDTIGFTCVSVKPPFKNEQNSQYVANCGRFLEQPGQLQPDRLITELTTGAYNAQDNAYYSLPALYQAIRVRAQDSRVYVVGYPNPLPTSITGNCEADILYENGNPVVGGPFNLVHAQFTIQRPDAQWMEKILSHLNSTVELDALNAGAYFIDNSQTMNGHDVCGNNKEHWIHGVVVKNGTTTPSDFTFHPNSQGQSQMADVVASAIAGPPAGGFTSTVFPGQFTQTFLPVGSGQLRLIVETAWPGSDVQLSLISPSGVVYDRTTQTAGVIHNLQANGESLSIPTPQAGEWTVRLYGAVVPANGEQVRVDSTQIPQAAFAPVAAIQESTDRGVAPTTVTFDGTASTAYNGAAIATYTWNFGDGTPAATGASQTHVFASAGSYTVTLTVSDTNGQTDTATNTMFVTATNHAPTATFMWGALDASNPTNLSFDASASSDVDGQIASYAWDFGDGSAGSGLLPTHTYTSAGIYPATLTVTDNAGLTASLCQAVQTGAGSGAQIVPCTRTTLASSSNPSYVGQPVNFTATVSPLPPGTGTPTGNVTFYDGATGIGAAALGTNGIASITVSNLTIGDHSITASYAGSASFGGSTSTPLVQSIRGFPGTVAAGWWHNIAAKTDGTAWAWGRNQFGQLGNGTTTQSNVPVQVNNLSGVVAVAAGSYHSIAVKSDGTAWTWGFNGSGQLGNGTTANSSAPVRAGTLTGITAVAAGCNFTVALRSDGTVWAWGQNTNGQLGNGTTTNSSSPVQVSNLTGATAISAGCDHGMALKSDGTVRTWGYNHNGQLGNGTTTNSSVPVQVTGLTNVMSISAGEDHSLAAKADGTAWAWGYNQNGQLGNGTTRQSTTPVQVQNLTNVRSVAGGGGHSLAMTSSGVVWAWGLNSYGQLGNGTTTNSTTPVQVSNLTGVSMISGGVDHSVAATTAGLVWDWGNNQFGQLGNGTTTNASRPVQVSNLTSV